jgi:prepilin-type N-terminal cleavage/methylation domain-containing protein
MVKDIKCLRIELSRIILSGHDQSQGFTLIELLVIVVITGILSAVILPQFLEQADKSRAVQVKATIGAIVRSQQAYRLTESKWAANCAELGDGRYFSADEPIIDGWKYSCNQTGISDRSRPLLATATGQSGTPVDGFQAAGTFDPASGSVIIIVKDENNQEIGI